MSAVESGPLDSDVETTDDGFLGGDLKILQARRGYRAGLEAVFLAASVPAASGETALEAGCGVGVASLCLAHRLGDVAVTGLDVEPCLIDLARRNARRNGLDGAVDFAVRDIRGGTDGETFSQNSRNHVFANPPFFTSDSARRSGDALKNRAHICEREEMEEWVRFMVSVATTSGTVTLIYRAEAMGYLLRLLDRRIGNCRIFPLYPRASQPASRVIIQGIKGSRAPASLLRGLVLHGDGDGFTPEAQRVLRKGEALRLA